MVSPRERGYGRNFFFFSLSVSISGAKRSPAASDTPAVSREGGIPRSTTTASFLPLRVPSRLRVVAIREGAEGKTVRRGEAKPLPPSKDRVESSETRAPRLPSYCPTGADPISASTELECLLYPRLFLFRRRKPSRLDADGRKIEKLGHVYTRVVSCSLRRNDTKKTREFQWHYRDRAGEWERSRANEADTIDEEGLSAAPSKGKLLVARQAS